MTERGRGSVQRSATHLQVGPSHLRWERDTLVLRLAETTAPWPTRLRGEVRLHPTALQPRSHALDAQCLHRWWPVAPCAQVEVDLSSPALRWRGRGYFDSNRGDEPLADAFRYWHWSRAALCDGGSAVMYDAQRRDSGKTSLALRFNAHGGMATLQAPPQTTLAPSAWRLARSTRGDFGASATVRRTLEDGPFYVRSLVASRWLGEPVCAMHESLSLDRFRRPWVQALLPFRMPRRPA
jgi:carotenoid 1,2-hydratase